MRSICVFCGSSDTVHEDYKSAAWAMGRVLAERGIRLIFGGGKTGLMGAIADGALSAGGEVIGVIIPSMNVPALAHDGLTRLEVPLNMHARKGTHARTCRRLYCPAHFVERVNGSMRGCHARWFGHVR